MRAAVLAFISASVSVSVPLFVKMRSGSAMMSAAFILGSRDE